MSEEVSVKLSREDDGLRVGFSIVSLLAVAKVLVEYAPDLIQLVQTIMDLFKNRPGPEPAPGPVVSK